MANIGSLILGIVADLKGFKTSIVKEGTAAGNAAGDAAGKGFGSKLKKAFSGGNLKEGLLGGLGLGAGLGAVGLLTKGVGALTDQVFASIDAASNLNEAMTKSEAVFGDSAKEIDAWAETASGAFGQSKRQALEAAGTFGNLIQAFGIGRDKAAEMSKSMTELASDLASFNNTSVEDAILALRSGLSGETEPLKRYGVAINEVRLKEEALRLGLIKTAKGTLPIAIKTQAAYSLILKDTALAQGDFANTSDGLANTQKTLAAQFEDLQAEIGEALLPIMLEFAKFVRNEVMPGLLELAKAVKENQEAFKILGFILKAALSQGQSASREFAEQYAADLQATIDENKRMAASTKVMASRTKDDLYRTGRSFDGVQEDAALTADAIEKMAKDARESLIKTRRETGRFAESFEAYADRIFAAARDEISVAFDIINDSAELSAVNVEKAELRKILATGKGTAEQKARYEELVQSQVQLILDLATNGAQNQKVVKDAIKQIEKDLTTATGNRKKALLALLSALRKVEDQARSTAAALARALATGKGFGYNVDPGFAPRAHGGPVQAGMPYIVGEKRPELFVPETNGYVLPSVPDAPAPAAAAGNIINVNLLDRMPVESVRDLGSGLRMLEDQGYLGKRKAS